MTTVNFAEPEGEEEHAGGDHEHTEGAIVVLDDAEAASAEFTRCESAVDFICFRAANAVLRFVGITPEEQARLTEAVSSLETGVAAQPPDGLALVSGRSLGRVGRLLPAPLLGLAGPDRGEHDGDQHGDHGDRVEDPERPVAGVCDQHRSVRSPARAHAFACVSR